MHNLTNAISQYSRNSQDQINDLIKELEKNVEYLKIFPGQELARAMMLNHITSLKQIQLKLNMEKVAEEIKKPLQIGTPYNPLDFKPVQSPLDMWRKMYPDTGGPVYAEPAYTVTTNQKVEYK